MPGTDAYCRSAAIQPYSSSSSAEAVPLSVCGRPRRCKAAAAAAHFCDCCGAPLKLQASKPSNGCLHFSPLTPLLVPRVVARMTGLPIPAPSPSNSDRQGRSALVLGLLSLLSLLRSRCSFVHRRESARIFREPLTKQANEQFSSTGWSQNNGTTA